MRLVRRLADAVVGGLGPAGLALFAATVAWAFAPVAAVLGRVIVSGGTFAGIDGLGVIDDYLYIAWIDDASRDGLISNRFDGADHPDDYLNPMYSLSGGLVALGAGEQLAFLAWKPVAVLVMFGGFAAYVRRLLEATTDRVAALALAVFMLLPLSPFLYWSGVDAGSGSGAVEVIATDMFAAGALWGYAHTAVSLGAMPVFLLACERALRGSTRAAWVAALAGLVSTWLHPWQGLVLLATLAGVLAWSRTDLRASLRRLALPSVATALPLPYYFVLSRTDAAWDAASSQGLSHAPGWLALTLAPVALLAIAGAWRHRGRPLDFQERALLLWPLAALAVYFALSEAYFPHALAGTSLPLGILAVRGLAGAPLAATAAVVAVLTLPGLAADADEFRDAIRAGGLPYWFEDGENDALRHLRDDPRPGTVIARVYLGEAVPAYAERRTWLGHPAWTPDYGRRDALAESLFRGRMDPARARAVVRSSGARFALTDCNETRDLRPLLGPLVAGVRRFGCAAVYELRAPARRSTSAAIPAPASTTSESSAAWRKRTYP